MKRYSITVNGKIFDVEVEEAAGKEDMSEETASASEKTETVRKGAGAAAAERQSDTPKSGKIDQKKEEEPGASIHRSRTPKTPKKKEPTVNAAKNAASADDSLCSPMPGTVLKVCVNPGDEVYAGETLIILEAMKMENEINSHKTGKVGMISVKTGDAVNTGDLLLTVE